MTAILSVFSGKLKTTFRPRNATSPAPAIAGRPGESRNDPRPLLVVCLAAALTLGPGVSAHAQDVGGFGNIGTQSGEPIKVTADVFEVDRNQHTAHFKGKAVVTQGSFELRAPQIDVAYGQGGASDVKTIDATGGVRMQFGDQTASGEKAHYEPGPKVLTLTGNVKVTGSQGTVTGPKLVVDLAKGTSQFTGSANSRVTGVFTTKGK